MTFCCDSPVIMVPSFHAHGSVPGKYQCDLFYLYVLSKFILDITDIDEGKYYDEIWTYL